MPKYLCQDGKSNKFWEYEIQGNDVLVKWGRVGLGGQEKLHKFGDKWSRDAFIEKKVAEKKKKKYDLVTEKKLEHEREIADKIGYQNKIQRVQWVRKKGKKLSFIMKYDPKQYVYVEILDSWKKDVRRLLLSKTESIEIVGVAEYDRTIEYNSERVAPSSFAEGVRAYLRGLAEKVKKAVKKFAVLGVRALDLGGSEADEMPDQISEDQEFINEVGDEGAAVQVVTKFAGLGARVLEL